MAITLPACDSTTTAHSWLLLTLLTDPVWLIHVRGAAASATQQLSASGPPTRQRCSALVGAAVRVRGVGGKPTDSHSPEPSSQHPGAPGSRCPPRTYPLGTVPGD
jgi:hypothetical protein